MARKDTNVLKIKLNDANNLRDLLQEVYNLADAQIIQAQQEMAKLASATNLGELCMEEKGKYAKAMNDFLMVKDKAVSKKIEVSKQMSEVLKFNGNTNDLANAQAKPTTFDFSKIREMLNSETESNTKSETIELKKDIKNK